jgi:hypothetical protein
MATKSRNVRKVYRITDHQIPFISTGHVRKIVRPIGCKLAGKPVSRNRLVASFDCFRINVGKTKARTHCHEQEAKSR